MKALQHQFDRQKDSLRNDLQRFDKKQRKTQQDIADFQRRLNGLNKVQIQMKGLFSKLKDSKEKKGVISRVEEQFKSLSLLVKETVSNFDQARQAKLFQGADISNPKTKQSDGDLINDNLIGIKNFTKIAHGVKKQTDDINTALVEDNQKIDEMNAMKDDIDNDVATTAKLTKIQKNQELLKRLTLIGLAVFLTLADVILLILKIR